MNLLGKIPHGLQDHELELLQKLRAAKARLRREPVEGRLPLGARVSDGVAATMGSWPFIIVQSILLVAWMAANLTAYVRHWDPYPFILLNLALSFQAAYAAPFIMMSQNRQADIDRREAKHDYEINIKAELEIELLHQKIDVLREKEVLELMTIIKDLQAQLRVALER